MDKERKSYRIFVISISSVIALFSLGIFTGIAIQTKAFVKEDLLIQARTHFKSILTTRRWNAMHGGVYVLKKEGVESNPYLEDPDITTVEGKVYTKKNPALMTREISELVEADSPLSYHITSLRPLNPNNKADDFERQALESFERGVEETHQEFTEDGKSFFRYMAPLLVEQPCLQCHAKQGYSVGDVRGGISITIDTAHIQKRLKSNIAVIVLLGVASTLLLLIIIYAFIRRLVSMLDESRAEIKRIAIMDELTALFNRRHGMDCLNKEFNKAQRTKSGLSCMILDIDRFKAINDTFGHLVGDFVLKQIASTIASSVRTYDVLFRFGGEEFVLVLPDTNIENALLVAEKIRQTVKDLSIQIEELGGSINLTLSVGVTSLKPNDNSVDNILRRADKSLYEAKNAGRDTVAFS